MTFMNDLPQVLPNLLTLQFLFAMEIRISMVSEDVSCIVQLSPAWDVFLSQG